MVNLKLKKSTKKIVDLKEYPKEEEEVEEITENEIEN